MPHFSLGTIAQQLLHSEVSNQRLQDNTGSFQPSFQRKGQLRKKLLHPTIAPAV